MADESAQGATPEQVEEEVEATTTEETASEDTQTEEEGEVSEEESSEEAAEQPKKKGIEKRFSDLTARAKAAEQYAQRLEALYTQQMELMQKQQQPPQQVKAPPATLPDRYDFNSDDEYQSAVDAYMDAQFQRRIQGLQEQASQRKQQETAQQRQAEMQKKISTIRETGAKTYEDFSEVAYVPQALVDIVAVTDNPHEIAYRWGKNPEEWQQLMNQLQSNPYEVAAKIGKIDAEISTRVKKQTAAPPPIKPVGGRGETITDPDKMPIDQWIKWREAQLKK